MAGTPGSSNRAPADGSKRVTRLAARVRLRSCIGRSGLAPGRPAGLSERRCQRPIRYRARGWSVSDVRGVPLQSTRPGWVTVSRAVGGGIMVYATLALPRRGDDGRPSRAAGSPLHCVTPEPQPIAGAGLGWMHPGACLGFASGSDPAPASSVVLGVITSPPGRLRSPARSSRAPGSGYEALRLGLRCGPRLAPADHHRRLPAGSGPLTRAFQSAWVRSTALRRRRAPVGRPTARAPFRSVSPPPPEPAETGDFVCSLRSPASGGSSGAPEARADFGLHHVGTPRSFNLASLPTSGRRGMVGCSISRRHKSCYAQSRPTDRTRCRRTPVRWEPRRLPPSPPFAGAPIRRPGSLDITASCGQGKLRDRHRPC
jgi:hypothetical protein